MNKQFESTMDMQKEINKNNDAERLDKLTNEADMDLLQKPILQYTFDDYVNGFGTNISGLMDDLINKPFSISIFEKDQRIFFLGILLLLIGIGVILLNLILPNLIIT